MRILRKLFKSRELGSNNREQNVPVALEELHFLCKFWGVECEAQGTARVNTMYDRARPRIREGIQQTISTRGIAWSIEELAAQLGMEPWYWTDTVVWLLGEIGDVSAIDYLLAPNVQAWAEHCGYGETRVTLWDALAKLGKLVGPKEKYAVLRYLDIGAHKGMCVGDIPHIVEFLRHQDKKVKLTAIRALGNLGENSRESIPSLLDLLDDGDIDIQKEVLHTFGYIRGPDVLPYLLEYAQHDNSTAWSAVIALGKLGDKKAKSVLVKVMENGTDSVLREFAAGSLIEFGDDDSILEACKALNDPKVCTYVTRKLGEAKNPIALRPLVSILKDKKQDDKYLIRDVLHALKSIDKSWKQSLNPRELELIRANHFIDN